VSGAGANVFNIPPGVAFVDALAQGVVTEVGFDPMALSKLTILLPTRRSVRSLREAFLRLGDGKPMLLPTMRPIGDVDEEAFAFDTASLEASLANPMLDQLPPAVSDVERQLLLAELVRAWTERNATSGAGAAQAIRLAAELARLIDQVQTARLTFDRLDQLVEGDLAAHWQATVRFLAIVTEHWPAILRARNRIDPAERRNRLLEALATQWIDAPPPGRVIAAGSTGSIPATADLLAVIAALPDGQVVLPGLDRHLDDASWQALEEAHPQYGLKLLLDRLDIERQAVTQWPTAEAEGDQPRARLASELMRPEATAQAWRDLNHIDATAIDGLRAIDCADPQAEAGTISLLMRETLEQPGRTAVLITADRNLARRVRAELGRWDLAIDDSAGRPLSESVPGVFLRLCLEALAEDLAPVPLLALLKHPLASSGEATAGFRATARALERSVLRGPRPAPGFPGLRRALAAKKGAPDGVGKWLDRLAKFAKPLTTAMRRRKIAITDLVEAHVAFAEQLAADAELSGSERLWAGEAGEACAGLFGELAEAARGLKPIAGVEYPALIDNLLQSATLRPRYGTHPRLAIWGPLEARLQHADLVILGGLNEGSWPGEMAADPWLSRPMRRAFGLPLPERMIGLAAHDFAQAFTAPEVVLMRAEKVDGTPTVPSRWLTRLHTVLRGAGLGGIIDADPVWTAWQAMLDAPEAAAQPIAPPEPRPPVTARPRALSVTRIERWMRDPYEIYARYVLDLRALEPLDALVNAADYGSYIHHALDRFVADADGVPAGDALNRLLTIGREVFAPATAYPSLWAFWWPRFERVAAWFVEREKENRTPGLRSVTEIRGELTIDAPGGPFLLSAIADRIDIAPDGSLHIIDYKTGAAPSDAEVVAGFAPQLPLEAAIAAAGGFEGVSPGEVSSLAFWRLGGGDPAGEERPVNLPPDQLAEEALAGLAQLVAAYDDVATPYPAHPTPAAAPRYSDYDHLARVAEWSASVDERG